MKKTISIVIVLTSVSLLWAARSNQNAISSAQQKAIEKEILKVHDEMKTAAEKLDADALFKYVLDVNDVIIESGELRPTRKDALESTKQDFQQLKSLSYTYNHQNINIISPTAAVFTGTGTTTATFSDLKMTLGFAETIVFVNRDGQWKVIHAHRSSTNL